MTKTVFEHVLSRLHDIARARLVQCLQDGTYGSIEKLAEANCPKVIRQNLRLAFLLPSVTFAILERRHVKFR
jgi:hypothetical protein